MQRIMITGQPGSGKSTLARMLGERTGLPVFYMDHIHHKPNWEPRPMAEKVVMHDAIIEQDAWIFEGGMSSTYDSRLARADTLIWIDIPLVLRFWRVVRRTLRHWGTNRPDLPEGCIERFDHETFEFWKWIWNTRQIARNQIKRLVENPQGTNVIHLRSLRQVNAWLDSLPYTSYQSDDKQEVQNARITSD